MLHSLSEQCPEEEQETRLTTAREETQDAIDVLNDGLLFPAAAPLLVEARDFIQQALDTMDPQLRRQLVQQALTRLAAARSAIVAS